MVRETQIYPAYYYHNVYLLVVLVNVICNYKGSTTIMSFYCFFYIYSSYIKFYISYWYLGFPEVFFATINFIVMTVAST